MKNIIEKLEGHNLSEAKGIPADGEARQFAVRMGDVASEAKGAVRDFKNGKRVGAAQGIQDLLSSLQSAVFLGFGGRPAPARDAAMDAIRKARQAVYKLERAISAGE